MDISFFGGGAPFNPPPVVRFIVSPRATHKFSHIPQARASHMAQPYLQGRLGNGVLLFGRRETVEVALASGVG